MGRLLPIIVATVLVAAVACGGDTTAPPPTSTPVPTTPTATPSSAASSAGTDQERSLTVDGLQRFFVVHVPPGLPAGGQVPVVVVLHGGGGNARNAIEQTGMSDEADRGGFLAVYPEGTGRRVRALLTWNAGQCCGLAMDRQVDDVAFVGAVIDQVQREFGGDPRRVYLTGFSNGAMLSYRVACELTGRIAAIAPVAGSMGVDCRPAAPISVLAFHGTADQHIVYEGGAPKIQSDPHPRQDPPVLDTMDFWAAHNGCTAPVTENVSGDTARQVRTCPGGTEVTLYTITDGGHAWPGSTTGRSGADRPTDTISATRLMWEFFQRHPRAP